MSSVWRQRFAAMGLLTLSIGCVFGGLGLWMIASLGVAMTYWFHAFVGGLVLGLGLAGLAATWWVITE